MTSSTENRYSAGKLISWASEIFQSANMEVEKAWTVAEVLVEGDLMGHVTHGLQLLPAYLKELENGSMLGHGDPNTVKDLGAAIAWDGKYLPGPWLTNQAISMALDRAMDHPVVTMTIRKSHHIGCLAAYPKRVTDNNLILLLSCSDPSIKTVAPFGGIKPLYTPNPLAAGFPTSGDPVIFDISMSTIANGVVARAHRQGKKLGGPWLLDAKGNATDEPATLFSDDPGTVLPLGGSELGYKGFALGMMMEALTSALGGHGRSDHPTEWGASVFLQIINPEAFGGTDYFVREMDFFSEACKATPVKPANPAVRIPGQKALQLKKKQLKEGVVLDRQLVDSLKTCGSKTGTAFPEPLA